MSALVFPTLTGIAWPVIRRPIWSTKIQQAVSGRETRIKLMSAPNYEFELTLEFLTLAEYATLMGFVNQVGGAWDNWLFTDKNDYTVTDMNFGTGDGSNKVFQLRRTLGGAIDPIQNVNVITNVKVNGVITGAYSINSTGIITFTSAPPNGQPVTWTGTYYWRVRFVDDTTEFAQFMTQFLEVKKLTFRTDKV